MPEIWKPVVGYAEFYRVSDRGRVFSERTKRCLKPHTRTTGTAYAQVALWRAGGQRTLLIHALVSQAFLGPRPKGLDIRHLNGDSTDNRLVNLEYATRQRNVLDMKWHDGRKTTKLWPDDVRAIKQRLAAGEPLRSIASSYGVHYTMIGHIKNGRVHTDVTVRSQTRPTRGLTRRVA